MITLSDLKMMKPGHLIAQGVEVDGPEGINMTASGRKLRWAAFRGGIHDWTIYCHWEWMDVQYIHDHGDKVMSEATIRKLVPCDDEAFGMYRY